MPEQIDVRGLSCPLPAMRVINALKQQNDKILMVLSDEPSACENIIRVAQGLGYKCSTRKDGVEFQISIEKHPVKLVSSPGTQCRD